MALVRSSTKRFRSEGLLTAHALSTDLFNLELQHSGACSLSLPYRRWHVVSFYVGPSVPVERVARGGKVRAEFRCGSVGVYPAGEAELIDWQGPTTAVHLHVRPSVLEALWRDRGGTAAFRLRRAFSTRDRVLQSLGAGLYDCARAVGVAYHSQVAELVSAVCQRLAERYSIETGPAPAAPLIGRVTLDALLDEMHGPDAPEMSVARLAARAGLSERRLRQAFKLRFGASPHDYLVRCRLELAKHLIQCDQVSLTTIAQESGFYDQAHFSRTFRARIGFSPSQFADWLRTQVGSSHSIA